jgi:acetyl esterase/lipase
MTGEQRAKIDSMLRSQPAAPTGTIEERRAGYAALLLQVGTNEVLLDDTTRMAARARDAGVDVILDVTAGVPHVFQTYAGVLDEADQALDRAALFLRQHLAPASPATARPIG